MISAASRLLYNSFKKTLILNKLPCKPIGINWQCFGCNHLSRRPCLAGRHSGQRQTRRKATKKYVFEFAVPACRQTGSPWFAVTAVTFQLLFSKHKPALLGYFA